MKVKSDHHSKFSNLSNWKEEAWKKNQVFNSIWTRGLCDTRTRDLRDMCSSIGRALHWYRGGHGFEFVEALIFFSRFFFPIA